MAEHPRSWAKRAVVSDPAHVAAAAVLRREYAAHRDEQQRRAQRQARQHTDGHTVMLRALPDYDALFGVDFTPASTPTPELEVSP